MDFILNLILARIISSTNSSKHIINKTRITTTPSICTITKQQQTSTFNFSSLQQERSSGCRVQYGCCTQACKGFILGACRSRYDSWKDKVIQTDCVSLCLPAYLFVCLSRRLQRRCLGPTLLIQWIFFPHHSADDTDGSTGVKQLGKLSPEPLPTNVATDR